MCCKGGGQARRVGCERRRRIPQSSASPADHAAHALTSSASTRTPALGRGRGWEGGPPLSSRCCSSRGQDMAALPPASAIQAGDCGHLEGSRLRAHSRDHLQSWGSGDGGNAPLQKQAQPLSQAPGARCRCAGGGERGAAALWAIIKSAGECVAHSLQRAAGNRWAPRVPGAAPREG